MDEIILKTNNLTKFYRKVEAVSNINMTIKKGEIYGLIGNNGAGKTTLIKLITGLSKKSSGSIELFGELEDRKIEKARNRIGAIVESPGVYLNKSIYENMNIYRMQKGIAGKECIEDILEKVGILSIKNKKVKSVSLGMKQRLGIAMALLGDPEFLILDEPLNAIDPTGIIEMRELLKNLNEEKGVTILISSHILDELSRLATSYGIIHKGKLIEELTYKELKDKCKNFIHIKVDNTSKATVILNKKLNTSNFEIDGNNVIKLYDHLDIIGEIAKILVDEGLELQELMIKGDKLENYLSKCIKEFESDKPQ